MDYHIVHISNASWTLDWRCPASTGQAIGEDTAPPLQYCVIQAIAGDPPASSSTPPPTCFNTFQEALSYATDGRVQVSADFKPTDLTDAILSQGLNQFGPDTVTGSTVIGIDWTGTNYSGSPLISNVDNPDGCSQGSWYHLNSMPSGWDNVISSAKAYQGCNHSYHYENIDLGGSILDCGTACGSMGAMDNATSSIAWTQ